MITLSGMESDPSGIVGPVRVQYLRHRQNRQGPDYRVTPDAIRYVNELARVGARPRGIDEMVLDDRGAGSGDAWSWETTQFSPLHRSPAPAAFSGIIPESMRKPVMTIGDVWERGRRRLEANQARARSILQARGVAI